jgi:O-acetyl-ADP-ribose deacetylase (regulator of RNase III)
LDGSRGEVQVLEETYRSICRLVQQHDIVTLSIPSIGTGIYRFPLELAAERAILTLEHHLPKFCNVVIVCFDEITLRSYARRLPVETSCGISVVE